MYKVTHALRLHNICSMECYYCNLDVSIVNENETINKVKNIHNTTIFVYGGEFIRANKVFLKTVLELLTKNNCTLIADTSGELLEYPEYLKYFKYINYHCTINLDNIIDEINLDNIVYEVVLTNENCSNLVQFLQNNLRIPRTKILLTNNDMSRINILKVTSISKKHKILFPNSILIEI